MLFKKFGLISGKENMSNANLTNVKIRNRIIEHVCLERANLSGSVLRNVEFKDCDLTGCLMYDAELRDVVFTSSYANHLSLMNASLINIDFGGIHIANSHFFGTVLKDVHFKGANINGCLFRCVDFGDGYIPPVCRKELTRHRKTDPKITVCEDGTPYVDIEKAARCDKVAFELCVLKNRDFSKCSATAMSFNNCVVTGCKFPPDAEVVINGVVDHTEVPLRENF